MRDLRDRAIHEAGHAIVAYFEGRRIKHISLECAEGHEGVCSYLEWKYGPAGVLSPDARLPIVIRCFMAGAVAEIVFNHNCAVDSMFEQAACEKFGWTDDRNLLTLYNIPEEEFRNHEAYLKRFMGRTVIRRLHERIVNILIEHGRLIGDDFHAIVVETLSAEGIATTEDLGLADVLSRMN